MPVFRFDVKVDNVAQVLAHLDSACNKTLQQIGQAAAGYAGGAAPVDTGALSGSYSYKIPDNRHVQIGSGLKYAPYVELGTGPNYEQPPGWITNNAQRGHHLTDPWWYMGDDGEWHLGWFVRARPHLRPAMTNHVNEYIDIFKSNLQNA